MPGFGNASFDAGLGEDVEVLFLKMMSFLSHLPVTVNFLVDHGNPSVIRETNSDSQSAHAHNSILILESQSANQRNYLDS